jgi:pyrimidine-specific ribonucleoside hydrolase
VHPEIFDIRDYYVDIELQGKYCRGATIADYNGRTGNKPNCRCVVDLDREKFVDYLVEACSKFEGWEV